jgi:ribosome biogenesis GTPase A
MIPEFLYLLVINKIDLSKEGQLDEVTEYWTSKESKQIP